MSMLDTLSKVSQSHMEGLSQVQALKLLHMTQFHSKELKRSPEICTSIISLHDIDAGRTARSFREMGRTWSLTVPGRCLLNE